MELMQYIAPLLQTLLWVGLVSGIVYRFHKPIDGLLTALQRRMEAGSTIEAGPFKLGSDVKPTPPAQQRERSENELAYIVNEQLVDPVVPGAPNLPAPMVQIKLRSRFFQAEELALRALQTELNAPINRQVSIGPGLEADGAFIQNDELHLVEVKFIVRPKNARSTIERTLSHYQRSFGATRRRTVVIILAVVFEFESDVTRSTLEFQEIANSTGLRVEVRGYSLKQLQTTYGLPADDA